MYGYMINYMDISIFFQYFTLGSDGCSIPRATISPRAHFVEMLLWHYGIYSLALKRGVKLH